MSSSQTAERAGPTDEAVDPGDTRALILHTAAALFLKHGYDAVSISQIIEEVSKVRKLTKPVIYYHFADKQALFVAVLLDSLGRVGRAITAASTTEGDLGTRVAALARSVPGKHGGMLALRSALSELDPEALERFRQARHTHLYAPLVAAFERFAAEGELRPDIPPAIAAMALVGITHTLAVSDMDGGAGTDVATLAADLVLNGIATQGAGRRGPPEGGDTG